MSRLMMIFDSSSRVDWNPTYLPTQAEPYATWGHENREVCCFRTP